MRTSWWGRGALLVGVVAALAATPALACVGLGCLDPWWAAPADGGVIPANAPALALTTAGGSTLGPFPDGGSGKDLGLELVLPDGGAQDLTVTPEGTAALLLRPATTLPEGQTLRLRFPTLCHAPDAGAPPYEVSFTTTAQRPLPTSLGVLTVKSAGHGVIPVFESPTCGTTVDGAWAQLGLALAPEVTPWLPLMRWRLLVDGRPWASEVPGALLSNGLLAPAPQYPSQFHVPRRVLQVHSVCVAGRPGVDEGAGLGQYTATLQGEVVGTGTVLEASTTITLRCSGPSQPPVAVEDGTPAVLPSASGCGCATAPGAWGVLGVAVLALRRRGRGTPGGR